MLMEFLEGSALKSWNTQILSKEWGRKLLDGLAVFLYSLWTIEPDAFHEMGKTADLLLGIFDWAEQQSAERKRSYRDWLQHEVDRGLRRALQGNTSWGDPFYCLYRRMAVDHIVASIPDDGRVAVKHGDLIAWNVIVSEDGLSG